MPVVAFGQGLPEAARSGLAAAAQGPGDDAAAGPLDGEPQPNFALLAAPKRPPLLQFQDFPAFFLRFFRAQTRPVRTAGLRFFLLIWPPSCALPPWPGRYCVANYAHPAACLPARTARPWPRRRARTAPGSGRPCTGSGRGPDCARYAEFGRCHIERRKAEYKPSARYTLFILQ